MRTLRKFLLPALLLLACCATAQPGTWTWMTGVTTANYLGNFGTQGVPAPSNAPPALYEAAFWTDLNGNFWVLGGYSANSLEAALWKFEPATNLWTWMKGPSMYQSPGVYGIRGVSSPANYPGSRAYGCATWTDNQNNLWLFGGDGYGSNGNPGMLNDLWKYNIATNEWTWMSGADTSNSPGSYGTLHVSSPSNVPPPRVIYSSWVDNNGDLWMYGGWTMVPSVYGHTFGDLWKYSIATGEWTWMHGGNTLDPPPSFGTKGVASASNDPGGRASYSHWKDAQGNFWFFGGNDSDFVYSDFWKYDPVTDEWTWMAGSPQPNDTNRLGAACESNFSYPLPRDDNTANWTDGCGRFWNLGGWDYRPAPNGSLLDDLWVFDPGTLLFTLVKGNQQNNAPPIHGTQLVPSTANYPGSGGGGCSFTDAQGNFWFFGGAKSSTTFQIRATLWKYVPDTSCVNFLNGHFTSPPATVCEGTPATFSTTLASGYQYYWNFGDSLNPAAGSTQSAPSYTYNAAGTYTVTFYYIAPLSTCLSPDYDTLVVNVKEAAATLQFPNIFSPNGDGIDDGFPGFTEPQEQYHLIVYNRWGQPVFETNDALKSWNGNSGAAESQEGVYFWTATVNDCRGIPAERHGFVHLVR